MTARQISTTIKEIIASVAGIDPADIGDDASFVDDMRLDSLALLEIAVDIDCEFELDGEMERLSLQEDMPTLPDAVALIMNRLQRRG